MTLLSVCGEHVRWNGIRETYAQSLALTSEILDGSTPGGSALSSVRPASLSGRFRWWCSRQNSLAPTTSPRRTRRRTYWATSEVCSNSEDDSGPLGREKTTRGLVRQRLLLRFDCDSTALRPFDDQNYDWSAALRLGEINRSAWLRLAGHITANVITFHKHSNVRRTAVESKSNRSCNHRNSANLSHSQVDLTIQ